MDKPQMYYSQKLAANAQKIHPACLILGQRCRIYYNSVYFLLLP